MAVGIWILGDQLNKNNSALLSRLQQKKDTYILFIESFNLGSLQTYHCQKLVLIWSAMRHFAQELKEDDWQVSYVINDNFQQSFINWIKNYQITELRLMSPSDDRTVLFNQINSSNNHDRSFFSFLKEIDINCHIKLFPNSNFLWQKEEFKQWAKKRKKLILEDFYRESRQRFNILLTEDNKPIGGKWNLDKENRQPPKKNLQTPVTLFFKPDKITLEVIEKVKKINDKTYGKIDNFQWAVKREEALKVLNQFVQYRLNFFGKYQDAMITEEKFMWHSLISPYLNIGLLQPLEVIKTVENAYYQGDYPLNSVEGFIRQILGWREYMYSLYHYVDDSYFSSNWFDHQNPIPDFFWDSNKTDMNCLHQVLKQTENTGYAHHIQRLMILSNYGLVAGISPQELKKWFHAVFIDAYDWVMQTNVLGMGQFADGGILASKPYASSANYINKMSDYCKGCCYNPKEKFTENACPFNYLYWNFLARHEEKLRTQGRMNLVLKHLEKMSEKDLETINFLAQKRINNDEH
ncbi:cryptochrome/photolyase family protein [Cyanobacterium stanieri LEGE 03274]|uniref:Cryptochrome/photolyase family protein n=1 Tax=Cyanobacterium stanieri LEGE 03274 TaxID=1828756 RepID=A0ABR9V7V1_9CHRO|nr:cryptochrome/photolyase family protein [Cyanobacterium stanieri]MBE9222904.1 cryptochrome/photolyase family protein [Cyanobacterium stanieri LEGE 03274]